MRPSMSTGGLLLIDCIYHKVHTRLRSKVVGIKLDAAREAKIGGPQLAVIVHVGVKAAGPPRLANYAPCAALLASL